MTTTDLRTAAQQALEALEKAVAEVKAQDVSDFADWQVLNLGVQNALTHLRAVLDAEKPTPSDEERARELAVKLGDTIEGVTCGDDIQRYLVPDKAIPLIAQAFAAIRGEYQSQKETP